MALDKKQIDFFLANIEDGEWESVGLLFKHLEEEGAENSMYMQYEKSIGKWDWENAEEILSRVHWPQKRVDFSGLEYEDIKLFVYGYYKHNTELNFVKVILKGSKSYEYLVVSDELVKYLRLAMDDIMTAEGHKAEGVIMGNKVFIIHGHDENLKREVQLLISRTALESGENLQGVVLHEQDDKGRTIIRKLIEESAGAGYAIAILTPDDIIAKGGPRARQNVILEIGYFIGRIGIEKVRLLIKGNIEIPTDLQGVLYQKYDDGGTWKTKLLKEMIAAGIDIDLGKSIQYL